MDISDAEILNWLKEKLVTDTFGEGDIKVQLAQTKPNTIWHVLQTTGTKDPLCKKDKNTLQSYTSKTYLWVQVNAKQICKNCTKNLATLQGFDDYTFFCYNEIMSLADEFIKAEKALKKPQKNQKYYKTILGHLAQIQYTSDENILRETGKQLSASISKHLRGNPTSLQDKKTQELLYQGYHKLWKRQLQDALQSEIINLSLLDTVESIPSTLKTKTGIKNRLKKAQKNIKVEVLEEQASRLYSIVEKYQKLAKQSMTDLFSGPEMLVRLQLECFVMSIINPHDTTESDMSLALYMLPAAAENKNYKAVLLPENLLNTLQSMHLCLGLNLTSLGEIEKTDTPEIMELVLNLDLQDNKKLPAARLLKD